MRFQDKVAIVTGASLGIGKATSEALAKEGVRVVLASRDPESGQKAAETITGSGGEAVFAPTDVSRGEECRALVDRAVGLYGRLDILVNNAGIYLQGDAKSTSEEDWNRILAVNLTGAFLCTKYAVPVMVRSGGGVIVNVSSEAGLTGIKGQVAYNVSKGGLVALTRSCAVDLAEWGIRVNCVCPGTTDTPLVREAVERAPDPDAARRRLEEVRPLNRLGTAEEIASAIVYLASQDAAYATGATLSVDGGYTAQ